MWRATLIALLTAERAQLDCLRQPGAYCLLAGRSTRQANAKSHGDRPAPAESRQDVAGGAQCMGGGGSHPVPSTTVWAALRYAESESIDGRFTPASMLWVALSAQPAADRSPLSGRLRPTPAKCRAGRTAARALLLGQARCAG